MPSGVVKFALKDTAMKMFFSSELPERTLKMDL
ncbi:hypothetical protein Q644_04640 [Brucella intermedia 229E]|uniref:Uncharacterized protein n=1 Tax=Brucella intermedia 229E TaxID=1337887 RepID=U4VCM7_9HYPH|nr:hypothetical protein Q644_04640 [Brucella intermedia 229E]